MGLTSTPAPLLRGCVPGATTTQAGSVTGAACGCNLLPGAQPVRQGGSSRAELPSSFFLLMALTMLQEANNLTRVAVLIRISRFWRHSIINTLLPVRLQRRLKVLTHACPDAPLLAQPPCAQGPPFGMAFFHHLYTRQEGAGPTAG